MNLPPGTGRGIHGVGMSCATECRCECCSHMQAPPRVGETTHKWVIQFCSYRQQHHLQFLKGVSKAYYFVDRQRTCDSEVLSETVPYEGQVDFTSYN